MSQKELYTLGIDIGSTTVKIALVDENNDIAFSDYERHFANIQETLSDLLGRAIFKLGAVHASPVITGSGGLTLAKHLGVPFVQEVIAVSTCLLYTSFGKTQVIKPRLLHGRVDVLLIQFFCLFLRGLGPFYIVFELPLIVGVQD